MQSLPLSLDTSRTSYLYAAIASSVMPTLGHAAWLQENILATRGWFDDHGGAYTDFPRLGGYRTVLHEELYTPDVLADEDSVHGLIVDSVRSARYLTILLDRAQLGPFFGVQRPSFRHEILVFGADPAANLVQAADFDGAGRLTTCDYPLDVVVSATKDTQFIGPVNDVPAYVAQTLSAGQTPAAESIPRMADAIRSFAEGQAQTEGQAAEWWQPASLHPVPDAEYLYGCDVIDERLGFDDPFSGADKHLQNVQLVLEQTKSCRDLIARTIGEGFCPVLAAHDEVLRALWAFKLSVLTFRIKGTRLECEARPGDWREVIRRSCSHFLDLVGSMNDANAHALTARHRLVCQ